MLLTLQGQDSQETFVELIKILNQKCQCNVKEEVVLRGGPPSVDGGQSNRKVKQINSENHRDRGPTSENHQVTF